MENQPIMRPIAPQDDQRVADIIRSVMTSFDCVGEGYSIVDPEVDDMYATYQEDGAICYVIEVDGKVCGVGGVAALAAAEGVCELKKMYFLPELRGRGMGRKLVSQCISDARRMGYTHMYLETVERMEAANRLYHKMGFEACDAPMGATGHNACDRYYLLKL